MSSKRKQNTNRGKRRRKGMGKNTGIVHIRRGPNFPPDVKQRPIQKRNYRFVITTGGNETAISMQDLLRIEGFMVTATNVFYPLFHAIKLKRLSFYSVPSSNLDTIANDLAFSFQGLGGPPETVTDRGTLTEPSCIKVVPQTGSLLDQFYDSTTPNVATTFGLITTPALTVVDVDVELVRRIGATGNFNTTNNAAVTGVHVRTLFGGVTDWVPDGNLTTIV